MKAIGACIVAIALACGCDEIPPGEYPNAGGYEEADEQVPVTGDDYADTDPTALTEFHSALDAHGTWVEDSTYGTVWVPAQAEVGADFTPYVTAGHWTYDDDWIWVSDWEWGWAPFHYGRWVWIDGRGWCWIPGRRYAGAWVAWQYNDAGYIGWAPLAPYWYWHGGVAVRIGFGVGLRYVYCERGHVFEPGIHSHVFWGERVAAIRGGMRTIARPTPGAMGMGGTNIPKPPVGHSGVIHAQTMAHPSSAASLGAHPPTNHVIHSSGSFSHGGGMGHVSPSRGGGFRGGGGRGGGGHGGGGHR